MREQERGTLTLLVAIGQRNGSEVHVEVYREAGKPPLLSIALYRRTRAGVLMRDGAHSLRFFSDEWRVLARTKLPAGKRLIPGAITHSNVTIEHPEVVADRMERWIKAAGAENVMFGNDCGFSSTAGNTEIPESVAWAKLAALAEGARLASSRL